MLSWRTASTSGEGAGLRFGVGSSGSHVARYRDGPNPTPSGLFMCFLHTSVFVFFLVSTILTQIFWGIGKPGRLEKNAGSFVLPGLRPEAAGVAGFCLFHALH